MKKSLRMISEKGRGRVPSRLEGSKDRVFAAYLDAMNPRANENVQQALAACPDNRFQAFLEKVMTPRYLRVSLATMAKGCGISLAEFQKWHSNVSTQQAIYNAQAASPEIVNDLIDDSKSKHDVCDRCDGLGSIDAPPPSACDPPKIPGYRRAAKDLYTRTCPRCQGEGLIKRPGDAHSRDRVLEIGGLKDSPKGASVVLNFGGASHSSAVALLNDAMSIETPAPKVVDADAEDLE